MIQRRMHKIKSDYGIADYYNYYNSKYKYKVNAHDYKSILRDVNDMLGKLIINESYELKLPRRLGIVYLSKRKSNVWLDDTGNLKTNRPINFNATRKLWDSDPKAKENKVYIRHENSHTDGYVYKISYRRKAATYKNKNAYRIRPHRDLTRGLARAIKENRIDTVFL